MNNAQSLAGIDAIRAAAGPIASSRAAASRAAAALLVAALAPIGLAAQADSTRRAVPDSSAQALEAVRIDVARSDARLDRLPWAVGSQSAVELRRAQATVGIDEALANIPGVVVANRYNFALDQRVSIRGAGSRANFGLRGIKVLLDGVPQSLPDGQSQLTNVDLAVIDKVEVLRGSASSLYGNGSGGVIAFTTDLRSPDPLGLTLRQTTGSFGLQKTQARVHGRAGRAVGMLSASRTTFEGFRQYSTADTRQLLGAVDYALSDRLTLQLRGGAAEVPKALNPGALTAAEYDANPDTAALGNVTRGASREVSQRYASVRLRGALARGEWSTVLYGQRRFVYNALAVTPPGGSGSPSNPNGTYNQLDRRVTGLRADLSRSLGSARPLRVSTGLDVQRSHDVRLNQAATGGRPSGPNDTLLVHQGETVLNLGPFVQAQWEPTPRLTTSAGVRYDHLAFSVQDRFLADGTDDTGDRTMTAASGHVGAALRVSRAFVPYANIATAFETPTTTELNASPDGAGGFNPTLGPQRLRTVEVGARGRIGSHSSYELAVFQVDATDAIVQFLETDGRAYFRNAGQTRNRGVELGVVTQARSWLELRAAWTWADYRFTDYVISLNATTTDTLDGNFLAGVPRQSLRLGARATLGAATLDVDHSTQAKMFGDDRNLVPVDGWGAGQLNIRAAYTGWWNGWRLEPFASVQNALNTAYVGAVTLNGFGGRVLEPAPLRNWYLGMEIALPLVPR
ncbi:MAG: TonB-dependent receptor [Gemmatimonadaceae bacterium]|nr:TonB-dependent receptor [Gemmatimonadaceae bacterium]